MFADVVMPALPISSTSQTMSALPNTPKSASDNIASSGATDSADTYCIQQQQKKGSDGSNDSHHQKFILAPTPAQLGRAPLQRRKNLCKFMEFFIIVNININ